MRDRLKLVSLALAMLGGGVLAACDEGAAVAPDTTQVGEVSNTPDVTDPDGYESVGETSPDATTEVAAETTTPSTDLLPPAQGFQIKSPPITVAPATEETYCYYFTLPLEEAVGVKRWESRMTAGSHHLIVYLTAEADAPDGTVTPDCDGFGGGISNVPVWTYSSQTRTGETVMPPGVGMTLGKQQHGYVQMHYLNPTLEPLEVQITVNGETFAPNEEYVKAAAFVTYNTNIQIPGGIGQTASAEGSCRVKPGISFFALSTHAHRRTVTTTVLDGEGVVFTSNDWEHPGSKLWDDPGYTFGGNLTYRCDYKNDLADPVRTGPSAQTDEMCMAVGYFYPAQRPVLCINSMVVSQ